MEAAFWWIKICFFSLFSVFFLGFGIFILVSAYNLENPFWFIMTFFSSNLIILISAVFLIAIFFRILKRYKAESVDADETGDKKE